MATPTYTLLDSVTLASSAASVTFSGISGTGKGDLVLVSNIKTTSSGLELGLRFNGSTTGYSNVGMLGNGSSALSSTYSPTYVPYGYSYGTSSTLYLNYVTQIMDYSATNKHKSVLSRWAEGSLTSTNASASRWANTAAITSVGFENIGYGSSFAAGSTFYLYQLVSE